jgi:glycosyltransferase involved in cell wall biosynthesis
MQIEVIIPSYNCEKYIEKCISSVGSQSQVNKISILDDGSTDDTLKKLQLLSSAKVSVLASKINKGNLVTVNQLIMQTESDYIAFQDADDWSDINRFAMQLAFMQENNLDFCFTNFIRTTEGGDELYKGEIEHNTFLNIQNAINEERNICFASILFIRKIYEHIGGFDSYFDGIGGADLDWYYRIIKAGYKGGILKAPLYYYRNNPVSYTSSVSLDSRKQISVEIARYFFMKRLEVNDVNYKPPVSQINNFIKKQLAHIGFIPKENLKAHIVELVNVKKYSVLPKHLIKYLFMHPIKFKDIKIINYILFKLFHA